MAYERDNIRRLAPYTPGEQPTAARLVKLNTNENPYPPSAAVLEAIGSVTADMLRRYPQPRAERFRETAARVHGVSSDRVMATNGGDELLRLAITVFCEPRCGEGVGGIAVVEPSYSLYPVLANIHDAAITRVPLDETFNLPADFADHALAGGAKLVMIVNPHAPSGQWRPVEDLAAIAGRLRDRAVLLIDEAYVDFADGDALDLVREGSDLDNVLLLRTLSKGYALAGLRFGYGLGHPDLIAALDKARDSYNTDVLAQHAAIAALEHRDDAKATWQRVIAQRDRLTAELIRRGYTVPPSRSNFVLATPSADGPDAATIYRALKGRGIFVRYFDQDRLRDKLRITIGTPEQNDTLLAELDRMKGDGG